MKSCRRGGMADALGSGPSSFTGVRVQLPPSAPDFVSGGRSERIRPVNDCAMRKSVRVWHNGCAPAFQAGYTGSTPVTRSNLVGFPSGQRGQTVNLLAPLSMVRIHLPPPFLIFFAVRRGRFFYAYLFSIHLDKQVLERFFCVR